MIDMPYENTNWLAYTGRDEDQLVHNFNQFLKLYNEVLYEGKAPKVRYTTSRKFTVTRGDKKAVARTDKQIDHFLQLAEDRFRSKVPKRRKYTCYECGSRGMHTQDRSANQIEVHGQTQYEELGKHTIKVTVMFTILCIECSEKKKMELMKKQVDEENAKIKAEEEKRQKGTEKETKPPRTGDDR